MQKNVNLKIQYYKTNPLKKCMYMQRRDNSYGCGSNSFYYAQKNKKVYAVCAACGEFLKQLSDTEAEKVLSENIWK